MGHHHHHHPHPHFPPNFSLKVNWMIVVHYLVIGSYKYLAQIARFNIAIILLHLML